MTRVRGKLAAASLCAAATTIACSAENGKPMATLVPSARVATEAFGTHVALVSEDIACLPDSYVFRVLCYHRSGSLLGAWGSEGGGPGEFNGSLAIRRWREGRVAVYDRHGISVFEPTGEMVSEFRLPRLAAAYLVEGDRVVGYRAGKLVELDIRTGNVAWERSYAPIAAGETECGSKSQGAPTPEGGWVFPACDRELVFLRHRDDENVSVVKTPNYLPELPNERDIAIQRSFIESSRFAGGFGVPPPSRRDDYMRDFASRPKRWFMGGHSIKFDTHQRMWVGTRRDRSSASHIDIWVDAEYVGSAQVRDRVTNLDILGSTLVTLVTLPGADGLEPQGIDWYSTADVEWGLK